MNKKMAGLIIGGLLGGSVLGVTFAPNVSSAAEQNTPAVHSTMMEKCQMDKMEKCQMDKMDMGKMMKSPEMQKKCLEMMKSPEMQAMMKNMMKTPEMQAMMKNMLSSDPALRQMMSDLVNSIDPNEQTSTPDPTQTTMPATMDHSSHQ